MNIKIILIIDSDNDNHKDNYNDNVMVIYE